LERPLERVLPSPTHRGGHLLVADLGHRVRLADQRARRSTVTSSAKAITSRNLWVIITTVQSCVGSRAAAQHLVGLLRRQHRGRFVEDQQPRLQVQLLQDLELLLLAGRQIGLRRGVQVQLERRGP
jgi:hypothetical protein